MERSVMDAMTKDHEEDGTLDDGRDDEGSLDVTEEDRSLVDGPDDIKNNCRISVT